MTQDALALLGSSAVVQAEEIAIDGSQLGDGYGLPTQAMQEAVRLMAHAEGLLIDPVYSGKAFAGRWPISGKDATVPATTYCS